MAGDDEKLLNKIRSSHKNNVFFQAPKLNKEGFIVIHTAKDVEYMITGFREKNKDELPKNIHSVFEQSKDVYIKSIYKNVDVESEDSLNLEKPLNEKNIINVKSLNVSNQKSLNAKFRIQMKELMQELKSCECHFVRCIKPNDEKKPNAWNGGLVLQQIRYLGVLESIKVRKESFPIRRPYRLFFQKYSELSDSGPSYIDLSEKEDFQTLTKKVLEGFLKENPEELILYGKTKIFLKNSTFMLIEKKYQGKIAFKNMNASRIQKAFYRYKQMRKLRMMFKALKKIKTLWKVRMEYLQFQRIRKSTRKIQAFYKKHTNEKNRRDNRAHCMIIQKYIRRYIDYKRFDIEKLRNYVIVIIRGIRKGMLVMRKRREKEISDMIIKEIFLKAWQKIIEAKVIVIQRFLRRFLTITKNIEIVKKIRTFK